MKSNLRRKLFMSLAATAACAATLTSTTFAWYTQNDTVTTDSVNAVTESTIDTGSIYISAGTTYSAGSAAVLYTYSEYKALEGNSEVTQEQFDALSDAQKTKTPAVAKKTATAWSMYRSFANPVLVNSKSINGTWDNSGSTPVYSGTTLIPVYFDGTNYLPMTSVVDKYTQCGSTEKYASGTVYYSYDSTNKKYNEVDTTGFTAGTTDVKDYFKRTEKGDVAYGAEAAANQMEFVYRFRTANAGVAQTVYFKDLDIQNTTEGTFPSQTALVSGTGTGIDAAGSYSVDLLSALKMTISITEVTKEEGDSDQVATAAASSTVYNFKNWQTHNNNVTTGDAVGYYNKALGTQISTPTGYTEGTTLLKSGETQLSFQIPATGYVEVRFVFWLDGWDSYCYDTCRQQSFKFSTNFTTSAHAGSGQTENYKAVYIA